MRCAAERHAREAARHQAALLWSAIRAERRADEAPGARLRPILLAAMTDEAGTR
ncbi:hypothetical protein [Methylobacterium gregans]|uniref:hypothetical protein n=1 Tax=Methylobacterium gregans TaxID=374424 RepID=UPI0024E18B2F|nr:hypothetical protein [Methylobacterium gregans]MDQ0521158.1 hypothetical protein [Methylobacterium gregans]